MRRLLPLFAVALGVAGCPPLSDDYTIVASDASAGADGALGGSAGSTSGGSGGLGGIDASSGGTSGGAGDSGSDALADAGCDDCSQTCCGAQCVDLDLDPKHCGACGAACPSKRSCNFGKCASGWLATAAPPVGFEARVKAAATWTGSKVFIWGGADANGAELANGALYDPLDDSWTLIPTGPNTPSKRVLATAVATGSTVVVFGGGDNAGTVDYQDGAVFDLGTQSWSALAAAPSARRAPIGIWTGTQVLFFDGWDKTGAPVGGSMLFDPSSGWTNASTVNAPSPRSDVAWAASGTDLYLTGGRVSGTTKTDEAYGESLSTGDWTVLAKGPSSRYGSFGAWDGTRFVVWGGRDDATEKADGKALEGLTWSNLPPATGVASGRWLSRGRAGWAAGVAPKVVLFVGGIAGTSILMDGAVLDESSAPSAWKPVPEWPSKESHEWGVGVWTGAELFVWGGQSGNVLTLKGERYSP